MPAGLQLLSKVFFMGSQSPTRQFRFLNALGDLPVLALNIFVK